MPTISGTPLRDGQVNEANPTTNYGSNVTASISGDTQAAGSRFRYHAAYDLAALGVPAGAVIDSATLTMSNFGTSATGFTVDVYERIADFTWTEAGFNWNTYDGTNAWAGGATGGAVHATDIVSTIRGTLTYTSSAAANTAMATAITTAVVQTASDSASRLLHLTLTRTSNGASPLSWNTKECGTPANRPSLSVTYHTVTATVTVTINPTRDTWTDQANATTNTGTSTLATVKGHTSTTPSYLHSNWDIAAAVPAGATVNTVDVYWSNSSTNATGRTYEVMEGAVANDAWTETGATYNTRDGTNAWAGGSNGGAVNTTDVAVTALGTGAYTGAAGPNEFVIQSSLTAATVQNYITGGNGRQLHTVLRRTDTSTVAAPILRARETTGTITSTGASAKPKMVINYTASGTAVVPGTMNVYPSHTIIFAETAYTGDAEANSVFLYEYRTPSGSGSYTAAGTYYDRANSIAYMAHTPAGFSRAIEGLIGLAPNTSYDIRLTVTDANGVTGTAVQTVATTTLTRATVATWPHNPAHYGRLAWNSTPPTSTYSTTTLTDVSALDYVQMTRSDQAANATLRGLVAGLIIGQYVVTMEIDSTGTARNSLGWDQPGWDEVNAQESWFLHTNAAQTIRCSSGYWLMNPGSQGFKEWWYRRHLLNNKQMCAQETSSRRFSSVVFLDNFSARPRAANVEYPVAIADGTYPDWRADIQPYADLLRATGIIVYGNITNTNLNRTALYLTEAADMHQHLDGGMLESMWKWYSTDVETYSSARQWKRDYDYVIARTAEGRVTWGINQIIDKAPVTTPDSTATRFGYLSSLMVIDGSSSLMQYYIHRNADSYNGGYQRLRLSGLEDIDLGLPTGAAFADTSGTSVVAADGSQTLVWRRNFANGYVRLNVDLMPTQDGGVVGAVHSGLNAAEGEIVLNANNPIPSISSISPASVTAGSTPVPITVTGPPSFVSTADVRIGGTTRTHSYVNATTMTVTPTSGDIASAGSLSITVVNPTPGGGTSNAATLTVSATVPVATSLSPSSVVEDIGGTITITGTGFTGSTVARLGGVNKTTTFINATSISFTYSAADVANPGTYQVDVV